MTLFWTVTNRRNHRRLIGNSKRGEYSGNIRGTPQANQLWKLRVKWPKLKPHSLTEHIPPQLALDRHQTRPLCFALQLRPMIGGRHIIQAVLPCYREVKRRAGLFLGVQYRKREIRR